MNPETSIRSTGADRSTLKGCTLGDLYAVVEALRAARDQDGHSEHDLSKVLADHHDQLDMLSILAAPDRPLRPPERDPEGYTRGGVATAACLRQLCLDIDSPKLALVVEQCEKILRRAPWYPHPVNRSPRSQLPAEVQPSEPSIGKTQASQDATQ